MEELPGCIEGNLEQEQNQCYVRETHRTSNTDRYTCADANEVSVFRLIVSILQYLTILPSMEIAAVSNAVRRLELNNSQLQLRCEESLKSLEKTVVSSIANLAPKPDTAKRNNEKPLARFEDLTAIKWNDTTGFPKALPDFKATISNAKAKITDLENYQKLLGSLCFDSISTRHEAIPQAHHDTFTWIFKGETPDGSHQIRFAEMA